MTARIVLRADAAFEALLGLFLVAGALTGGLDASDFPSPVGRPVVLAVGVVLLVLAWAIWTHRIGVAALAAGNALSAALGVAWLVGVSGFSTAGAVVVAVTVAALVVLAVVQVVTLRTWPSSSS
jgi:hypothetical protein